MVERDRRGDDDGPWDGIDVYCEGCTHLFRVPASLKGGLANCPNCRRATTVPGNGPEPLFWVLLAVGILVVLGIAAGFFATGNVTGGVLALLIGAAVLLVIVLSS